MQESLQTLTYCQSYSGIFFEPRTHADSIRSVVKIEAARLYNY